MQNIFACLPGCDTTGGGEEAEAGCGLLEGYILSSTNLYTHHTSKDHCFCDTTGGGEETEEGCGLLEGCGPSQKAYDTVVEEQPYGPDVQIVKEECINHISKPMWEAQDHSVQPPEPIIIISDDESDADSVKPVIYID